MTDSKGNPYIEACLLSINDKNTKIAELREQLDRNEAVINNLAAMLRRIIWQADKAAGDTSIKVLSGKARELLQQYGLSGNPLRKDEL